MTQNPNTSTPAVADLPQRLVDAAYNAAYDVHYDVDEAEARAATVAVLKEFSLYLDTLTETPPDKHANDYHYQVGILEGIERAGIHAHDIAADLEER